MKYNTQVVLAYFKEMRLPYCVPEFTFCEGRKFRWDFAFVDERVALEVQGGVWNRGAHGRGTGIVRDMEKFNLGLTLGWRVVTCRPDDVCVMDTVDTLKKVLAWKLVVA